MFYLGLFKYTYKNVHCTLYTGNVTKKWLSIGKLSRDLSKENRIYIRGEFTRKKCKTAILLYCFHTAGVLHIFMLYKLEYHLIENLKLFDQLSLHIDSMPFTLQMMIFRYNYKSNDVFYSHNSL